MGHFVFPFAAAVVCGDFDVCVHHQNQRHHFVAAPPFAVAQYAARPLVKRAKYQPAFYYADHRHCVADFVFTVDGHLSFDTRRQCVGDDE